MHSIVADTSGGGCTSVTGGRWVQRTPPPDATASATIPPEGGVHIDNRWSVGQRTPPPDATIPGLERGRDLDSHALCFHAILVPYLGFAPLVMRPSLRRLNEDDVCSGIKIRRISNTCNYTHLFSSGILRNTILQSIHDIISYSNILI